MVLICLHPEPLSTLSGQSQVIKIIPQGDLGGATKKTVVLTLQPGDGYTVGTTGKVKVKITD